MMNRLAPLWLIVGLFVGYAISGPSVKAQDAVRRLPNGINQGDKVSLRFAYGTMATGGHSMSCTISGISDPWIRCAASEAFDGSRDQVWYDLTRVVAVTKPER